MVLPRQGYYSRGYCRENTIGALRRSGESVYHQDVTKMYDNAVGRAVDRANEWMQYNFPNFATKAEQNATGLQSLGYANFWADKVANGLGYSLGSVATVYLTGVLDCQKPCRAKQESLVRQARYCSQGCRQCS